MISRKVPMSATIIHGAAWVVALPLLAGCGSRAPEPALVTMPAPPLVRTLDAAPYHANRLDTVVVQMSGLSQGVPVQIGLGTRASGYRVVTTAAADGRGRLKARVPVPSWAEAGGEYVWLVLSEGGAVEAMSEPILVAPTGKIVTIHGHTASSDRRCPSIRSDKGKEYALLMPLPPTWDAGTPLIARGRVAAESRCGAVTMLEVIHIHLIR